ncbi:MAG: hypothetical protein SWK90_14285 [Chloroflexota bacterium]|nr:hypothetical protein [Chloroflexota bacterium]
MSEIYDGRVIFCWWRFALMTRADGLGGLWVVIRLQDGGGR